MSVAITRTHDRIMDARPVRRAEAPVLTWNAFPASTTYFAPSTGEFMINYAVGDMDAFLSRLHAKGVAILKRDDGDPNGRFAWILDPEGNKIELWEPKHTAPP
jgi:predicted enzyme related to lactoylglutathione lyase